MKKLIFIFTILIGLSSYAQDSVATRISLKGRVFTVAGVNGLNGTTFSRYTQAQYDALTQPQKDTLNAFIVDAGGLSALTSLDIDTSAEIAAIVTDETGTGSLVFSNSPTLITPDLGEPSAIDLRNANNLYYPNDIGGTNKTFVTTDWNKDNYTDNTVTFTIDNTASVGDNMILSVTDIDSVITVLPASGVSFYGNGADVITDAFQIDSLNSVGIKKMASNLYRATGYFKPYTQPTIPVVESSESAWVDGSSSIVVNKPTGVATNDLLLILVGNDAQDIGTAEWSGTQAPTGFTFHSTIGDATSDNHLAVYYRIADGTEASTFTVPQTTNSNDMWIACLRISGASTTTPIGVTGPATITTASSVAITQITTINDNSLIIGLAGVDGSDMTYSSLSGNGWTLGAAVEGAASTDNTNGVWVQKDQPTAGATGSPTITWSLSDGIAGYLISINPL